MSCTSCKACPAASLPEWARGGPADDAHAVDRADGDYTVALAGNPNTGKTTVFNSLTGLRQHTGNWPGKTVTRAEGRFRFEGHAFRLVDLPGTYSLLSNSVDEEIARDFLLFGGADVTVVVVDAGALERNLGLALQVLEITERVVVCVNLVDEARRKGIRVDTEALAAQLGVPVVATAALRGEGLAALSAAVCAVALGRLVPQPRRVAYPAALEEELSTLSAQVQVRAPGLPNARWVALRLLEGDSAIAEALQDGRLERLAARLDADRGPEAETPSVSGVAPVGAPAGRQAVAS